ncbi:hypothetical protein [Phormidium sp. CCY1219]|jgi:hypothetical protein|uniref:hypothetical protein n=1 Tax=Phormidium sp. CCY1219 TaxID=2886104 RepID=UPI002D1F019D|nr:hypothetical protein [Phormidium sp. CCY1219]MEB3827115.1 hypothetical protein [Phormidium sp. CCY1219]
MNEQSSDRDRLVAFLQQHRPEPPPPAGNLEARIMASTANSLPTPTTKPKPYLWLLPPALAAGLLLVWGSYKTLAPPPQTATELAQIEAFMENTWDNVLEDAPEGEWLFPNEAIAE